MTAAEARRQIREIAAVLRGQGQDAAADGLHRALRRHLKGRIAARAKPNTKAPAGRLARLPTLRPIA